MSIYAIHIFSIHFITQVENETIIVMRIESMTMDWETSNANTRSREQTDSPQPIEMPSINSEKIYEYPDEVPDEAQKVSN